MKSENMLNLLYSPGYMPLNEKDREIWTILIGLGYDPVRIIEYEPKKRLVVKVNGERKEIDLSWAFRETETDEALKLVRRIFRNNWLDFEELYEQNGWKVKYDKSGYC